MACISLPFRQAWREAPEPGFRPGTVDLWWEPGVLHVRGVLVDDAPVTRAEPGSVNERLWELGDAFELFLKPDGDPGYVECHIAPNDAVMQLRFPDHETIVRIRAGDDPRGTDGYFVAPTFARTVDRTIDGWAISVAFPHPAVRAGARWRVSFSRYDVGADFGRPIVSSTSDHRVADFHDAEAWTEIVLHTPS